MKKNFCDRQDDNVKRLKNEISANTLNKQERFPFNDSFYQFYTGFAVIGSCADSTKQLIAVLYQHHTQSPHYFISIYTVEGYLVTRFRYYSTKRNENVISVEMFLSDQMILLITQYDNMHVILQYTDYTYNIHSIRQISRICFDCDEDYIYIYRRIHGFNYISLYTHAILFNGKIASITGDHLAMKVSGNCVYILNSPFFKCITNSQVVTELLQLSLPGGEMLQYFDICSDSYTIPRYLSFHPSGNLIIGYTSTDEISILYHESVILPHSLSRVNKSLSIRTMAVTVTGELVCASYSDKCIRVYPPI